MDRLTIVGLLVAVSAIFGGQLIEGGKITALLNPLHLSLFLVVPLVR